MQSGFDAFSLAPGISSCDVLLFNVHDEFVQIKVWFTLANIRLAGLYESHVLPKTGGFVLFATSARRHD